MKAIKLAEFIEALEFDSEEQVARVDPQNDCVVMVERPVLDAVEEGDEKALGDVPNWQKDKVEIARVIVADSGERFVDAPDKFDFHEYRQMERFTGTVTDAAAEQLWRATKGKGTFHYFKARRLVGLMARIFSFGRGLTRVRSLGPPALYQKFTEVA